MLYYKQWQEAFPSFSKNHYPRRECLSKIYVPIVPTHDSSSLSVPGSGEQRNKSSPSPPENTPVTPTTPTTLTTVSPQLKFPCHLSNTHYSYYSHRKSVVNVTCPNCPNPISNDRDRKRNMRNVANIPNFNMAKAISSQQHLACIPFNESCQRCFSTNVTNVPGSI